MKVAAVLRRVGRPKAGEGKCSNRTFSRGDNAAYLAARLCAVCSGVFGETGPRYIPGAKGYVIPMGFMEGPMPRSTAPSDTLRASIVLDGRPVTQIARGAGLPHPVVSRFMRGKRGLSSRSIDRLANELGLVLRPAADRAA